MHERQADDPTPGVVESVRLMMRTFARAHHNRGEGLAMERRRLLQGMLAATGLYATDAMVGEVSAYAATHEMVTGSSEVLADVTRTLHEICVAHMAGAPVEQSQQRALACWRDALGVKVNVTGPRTMRAAEMESKAACLVAQFYGDLGQDDLAARWYKRALEVAPGFDMRAWIHSCSAWIPMFHGDGEGTVKAAENALGFVTFSNPIQETFALHQLARGQAIQGDREKAIASLTAADVAFNRYGYYGKNSSPSLDGFSKWQHAAYSVNTYALLGEVKLSREPRTIMSEAPFVSGINHMLHQTSEAACLVHEGQLDGAMRTIRRAIDGLSPGDAETAVVRGRAKTFITGLPEKMSDAREVRDFREYLAAA